MTIEWLSMRSRSARSEPPMLPPMKMPEVRCRISDRPGRDGSSPWSCPFPAEPVMPMVRCTLRDRSCWIVREISVVMGMPAAVAARRKRFSHGLGTAALATTRSVVVKSLTLCSPRRSA